MKSIWTLKRLSIVAALAVILMLSHGVFFYYAYSRLGLVVVSGAMLLVLLKHVGLFGPAYAYFRRKRQRKYTVDESH